MDSTSNFRLFRKNGRILKPKLIREGRVLFWDRTGDGVTNRPHICVKNRNNYVWQDLSSLSSNKFQNNRIKISDNLTSLFKTLRKEVNNHNVTKKHLNKAHDVNREMFAYMFNKMNGYERTEFLKTFPDQLELIKHRTCPICDNITTKEFVKCKYCFGNFSSSRFSN